MRPVCATLLAALAALLPAGCSTLGLSSPRYKLTKTAEAFRDAATPPPALNRELAKAPLAEYILEPGDSLLIQPVDYDSPVRIAADQPILPDGTIELGEYGRPVVTGLTPPAVEARVRELVKAKEKKDIAVTVRLVGRQSKVYYVFGEVNSPGSFPLSGRETVLDGLVAAGGITRAAQDGKIILSRPSGPDDCRTVLPVCYPQIVQLGDTTTNYQLRPGDRIYVPSQSTLESIFGSGKKTTAPCCKPNQPCYGGGAGCAAGGAGVSVAAPVVGQAATFDPVPAPAPVLAPTLTPLPAR